MKEKLGRFKKDELPIHELTGNNARVAQLDILLDKLENTGNATRAKISRWYKAATELGAILFGGKVSAKELKKFRH